MKDQIRRSVFYDCVFDAKKNVGVFNSTNNLIKELDQVLPKK